MRYTAGEVVIYVHEDGFRGGRFRWYGKIVLPDGTDWQYLGCSTPGDDPQMAAETALAFGAWDGSGVDCGCQDEHADGCSEAHLPARSWALRLERALEDSADMGEDGWIVQEAQHG